MQILRQALPILLAGLGSALPADDSRGPRIGETVKPFEIQDLTGASRRVFGDPEVKAVVIAFSAVTCPVAKAQAPRLGDLARQYKERGVSVYVVNPNPGDADAAIAGAVKDAGIEGPVVADRRQELASRFGVERTTEVFVFEGSGKLRYRGALDDQHSVGLQKPKPQRFYVQDALDAVLEGKEPAITRTVAKGCLIGRVAAAEAVKPNGAAAPAYHADVAPILRKHCAECHSPGEVGPFPLLTYDDAEGVSRMVGEVVENGRMPPWHANPKYGSWANERRLSDSEKSTLLRWVAAGAPEGPKPAVKEMTTSRPSPERSWRIGKPDLIVKAPKQKVPAQGTIEYRYLTVPTNLTEDRWVAKAEVHAGNKSVIHHVLIFCQYPKARKGEQPPIDGGLEGGFFASLVPGERPNEYPPDAGKLLPAGAQLIFQMHYTANGVKTEDETEIGFVFHKVKPARVVTTRGVTQRRIRIQPNDPAATFNAKFNVTKDVEILSFLPHMHFRGKAFRYDLTRPDGSKDTLLDVPQYDFNWQATYYAAKPVKLETGSVIECTGVYDNSAANPANPNPNVTVKWGDQTWDEMFIGYLDFVES